jgi:hypothetical protein
VKISIVYEVLTWSRWRVRGDLPKVLFYWYLIYLGNGSVRDSHTDLLIKVGSNPSLRARAVIVLNVSGITV